MDDFFEEDTEEYLLEIMRDLREFSLPYYRDIKKKLGVSLEEPLTKDMCRAAAYSSVKVFKNLGYGNWIVVGGWNHGIEKIHPSNQEWLKDYIDLKNGLGGYYDGEKWNGHYFAISNDKRWPETMVADFTADQFKGGPELILGPLKNFKCFNENLKRSMILEELGKPTIIFAERIADDYLDYCFSPVYEETIRNDHVLKI